ncbi:MAG: hypothetical protein NVS3B5_02190 [Sphingomicrobium sp.]
MPDPAAILNRIRTFGANVMSDNGNLIIVNREKLPKVAIDFIKQNGREIASFLDREAEFEERAAIIQYDGGLNRSVAEYLTRLLMASPPEGSESDWTWFVGQAALIIDRAPLRKAA